MTLALDALVFVKVCNLWWVSDKVPQGRGVASVQLLSLQASWISTSMTSTLTMFVEDNKCMSIKTAKQKTQSTLEKTQNSKI